MDNLRSLDEYLCEIEEGLISNCYGIHENEFEGSDEYKMRVRSLADFICTDRINAAILYTAEFFYRQGIRDYQAIKDAFFQKHDD